MNRHTERGNVLWFIMIAIALLGALTMMLSRSGSSVDQSADVEQNRVKSGQILRYAKGIETTIEQMKLRGISENLLSFQNTTTTVDYTNAACTGSDCKIFDGAGGGQAYQAPPKGSNDGSEWIFTAANNVGTTADPVVTTAAGSGNDLIMLLPKANDSMCKQINKDLKVGIAGTLPTDAGGALTTAFTGSFPAALNIIDGDPSTFELDAKNAGCFIDTNANPDVTYFYYVVLAR